jgi:fructose/tagatose bisphosphate aldolase
MPLVPLKSVLGQATREGFADGAFNVVNLDHGKSVESVKRAIKHGFIAEEEAIRLGIRKVNYYTEMAMAAFGTIKARLHAAPAEYGPGHSDYPL